MQEQYFIYVIFESYKHVNKYVVKNGRVPWSSPVHSMMVTSTNGRFCVQVSAAAIQNWLNIEA